MSFDEEKQIQQLISMYRQGFEEILRIILEKEAKGQLTQYWRDLLLNVQEVLKQLDDNAGQWIKQTVGQVYTQAAAQTAAYLSALGRPKAADPQFAQIHQQAIDVVAQNMADNLRDATQFIGRRINDVFRRVGLEQTGRKLAAGQTVQDMKQRVVQQLLDKGQTAFVDRLGRKWRLDTYAEMVARTTTREAASVATLNSCREFGVDLVKITEHYPTCERCAPLQGKVFSISGKDKRYPKLTDERRPPIHPHCRHVLTSYLREYDDHAAETERRSNEPLDKDPRSEAEKQAYGAVQQAQGRVAAGVKAATRAEAEIVLLLRNALPNINDRLKLTRTLLDDSGMQYVPLAMKTMMDNGYTGFAIKGGIIEVTEVTLRAGDQRPWHYRVKTAFHEFTHARANGAKTKARQINILLNAPGALMAEETIAETVAHYLVRRAGISDEIVPSYSEYLTEMLPKLKKRPKFSKCKTLADFGSVLCERRFGRADIDHYDLNKIAQEPFDLRKYAERYRGYVFNNIDEIVDAIAAANSNQSVDKTKIKNSIISGWTGTHTSGFFDSLIIAMNRLGVQKP